MAQDILINDGGAPARILPFVAATALTAGMALSIDVNGKAVAADVDLGTGYAEHMAGVALNDAALGEIVSLVSGKGIIVRCNVTDEVVGKGLKLSSTAGTLMLNGALGTAVAINLEDTGAIGLHKVLMIGG